MGIMEKKMEATVQDLGAQGLRGLGLRAAHAELLDVVKT